MQTSNTPDLRTREGCVHFVENTVLRDLMRTWLDRRNVPPFGLALGAQSGCEVITVGAYGLAGRDLKRAMQNVVEKSSAAGSLYVRRDDFELREGGTQNAVVVQLEHKAAGDLAWVGFIRGTMLDKWNGPSELAAAPVKLQPLRFLAYRWKS